MNKKSYGQFYTTNAEYILQGLVLPEGTTYIEPFVGKGDLLPFFPAGAKIECYDIEPKIECEQRDIFADPPDFAGKIVLTNPPYLARNKNPDKTTYEKYKSNDLYKCFVKMIGKCAGGILILPVNFFSSIRASDVEMRSNFMREFLIHRVNVFEEEVFEDTSTSTCAFSFERRAEAADAQVILMHFFPQKYKHAFELSVDNGYIIGGHIYKLPQSEITIGRYTSTEQTPSVIAVNCIDSQKAICAFEVREGESFIDDTPNNTNRTYMQLVFNGVISIPFQRRLIIEFNDFLNIQREKYNSMFLTNYRESKNGKMRKRISFNLIFIIFSYLLQKI